MGVWRRIYRWLWPKKKVEFKRFVMPQIKNMAPPMNIRSVLTSNSLINPEEYIPPPTPEKKSKYRSIDEPWE